MVKFKKQFKFYIIGSLVFLAIPFLNPPPHSSANFVSFNPLAQQDFIRYLLLLIFFYINYFLLIPKLYFTKKYVLYFSLLLMIMFLISSTPQLFVHSGPFTNGPFRPDFDNHPPPGFPMPPGAFHHRNFFLERIDHNLFLFMAVALFSLFIKISNRWRQTEKQRVNAELSYLKAQINPHFLFNSLNSIYSLAIQKADNTAEAVQELSTMMRYVLNESTKEYVPLQKELDYIFNYISFQRIRFGNELNMQYHVNGDPAHLVIAPLVLIPFIENCFKYGVNAEEDTHILIDISIRNQQLHMKTENNIVTTQRNVDQEFGIGIKNTRARLHLIYPSKHQLQITEDKNKFLVNITLDLS